MPESMAMPDQPDHSAIVAKVAVVEERTNTILRRLDKQDAILDDLGKMQQRVIGAKWLAGGLLALTSGGAGALILKLLGAFDKIPQSGHQ